LNETQLSSFEAGQESRNETKEDVFHVKKKFSAKRKDKLSTSMRKKGGLNRRSVKTKVRSMTQVTNVKESKYLQKDKKCGIIEIAKNATLNSGMNAGNFKLHGKSNGITHCAKLCCKDHLCDIALIMTGRCYTVQCFSKQDCQSRNVDSKTVDNVIAYIDNPSKKLQSDKWYIKQAKHRGQIRQNSKKTVLPNPNEGNKCVS